MGFDWDDAKADANKKKHGISFAEAATAFKDPNALEVFDDDHSGDEERWILVGLSTKSRVLLVVFVEKQEDDMVRIISARKAEKEETDQYYLKVNQ